MKPFTMWVVVSPDGWPWEHGVRRTRREAIKAWLSELPYRTWASEYREGYRCIKVRVTAADARGTR